MRKGGFRLYLESYLCQLIRDLPLFGYTLDALKARTQKRADPPSGESDA
jgi:hypothetical protein